MTEEVKAFVEINEICLGQRKFGREFCREIWLGQQKMLLIDFFHIILFDESKTFQNLEEPKNQNFFSSPCTICVIPTLPTLF